MARVPPADEWDVWTLGREEMQRDTEMQAGKERMVAGLEMAMRMTAKAATRNTEARTFRGAWITARTGQVRWRPALESVVGGMWAGARGDTGRRTDTDKGIEKAVKTVQRAAGAMLVRWNDMGARARRWTAWREVQRERGKVVLHAWKAVCERQKGTWRVSSRQGREREVWAGASDELTPRWMEEWSYRPGVSAVTPGTWGGWLMEYVRTHAAARRAERP